MAQEPVLRPPADSLIPPGCSTGAPSPERGVPETCRTPEWSSNMSSLRRLEGQEGRIVPRSPLSPDKKSQRKERNSAIDAVKQITGALKKTPAKGKVNMSETPEYDWDTRYDGIPGFPSRLRNRISEPSTPQRGQSPRSGPGMPPEPQRYFKQLKVYDETPAGRPLPTLQQIRQANLHKIFEEEGADKPCDICGDPRHDHRNCTKEAYLESEDVRQGHREEEVIRGECPHCDISHPGICPCAWCDSARTYCTGLHGPFY